jgi:nucleoside-diphosphate-sugar epimerase
MQGSTGRFAVDPRELAGKRALVTGGTKGMGEAIARRLAAAGATVATTARSPLPHGQQPDLFGGIDVLINNVGGASIQRRMPLYQATLAYAAAKAASIAGTEYVIDGGTVPTV